MPLLDRHLLAFPGWLRNCVGFQRRIAPHACDPVGQQGMDPGDQATVVDACGEKRALGTVAAGAFDKISDFKIKFWFHMTDVHRIYSQVGDRYHT